MRRKIRTLIVLSAMIIFSGCEDFLTDTPESVLTQTDFFTTPIRIDQGIIGCYAGMANILKDEWQFTEMRSDNTCVASTGTSSVDNVDYCDFKFFRTSPSAPRMQDFWYKIFQNISNVNAILPSVADNRYMTNETLRAQYEAELLFIRAYHYYTLVNLWGDMFKVTKIIGPAEAKQINRSPIAEIYSEIIFPDLIKAAEQAPSVYPAASKGRITKWAAKSLLAKAYMMAGGTENLAKAKTLLEEVMTLSPHKLLTGAKAFENVFSISNEMNDEIIFAVRYKAGSLGIGSPFWGLFAPEGSGNIFLKVGTPSGENSPTWELMNLFLSDTTDKRTSSSLRIWYKSATDSSQYKQYISKYMDPTMSYAEQSENDWIVIRFADVVLLYAEILAQDGNHGTAHNEVNKIRARAGVATFAAPFASKNEALDSIYKERRLELAFENQRWFDLLRMNKSYGNPDKAVEILKQHVFVTDWLILYGEYSKISLPEQSAFITKRLVLPIPQTEIDTNNELEIKQNDGYN